MKLSVFMHTGKSGACVCFLKIFYLHLQIDMDATAAAAAATSATAEVAADSLTRGPAASVKKAIDSLVSRSDALKSENTRLKAQIADLKKKGTRPRLVKNPEDAPARKASAKKTAVAAEGTTAPAPAPAGI